jgi:hypothetical protein
LIGPSQFFSLSEIFQQIDNKCIEELKKSLRNEKVSGSNPLCSTSLKYRKILYFKALNSAQPGWHFYAGAWLLDTEVIDERDAEHAIHIVDKLEKIADFQSKSSRVLSNSGSITATRFVLNR